MSCARYLKEMLAPLRVYRLESRQTGDKMSIYYMYAFL